MTANWTVNSEAKTATTEVYGGVLVLNRRADNGKLEANFERVTSPAVAAIPAEGDKPAVDAVAAETFKVQIPLHQIDTVAGAQVEALELLKSTLIANGRAGDITEAAEAEAPAAPDPF